MKNSHKPITHFFISILAAATFSTSANAFPLLLETPSLESFLRVGDSVDDIPQSALRLEQPNMQLALDARLKARFAAAAGPSIRFLTAKAANEASWGFLSDHFTEIDTNGDGFVTFDDVKAFMDARSPLKTHKGQAVQIVE